LRWFAPSTSPKALVADCGACAEALTYSEDELGADEDVGWAYSP
jgi:hypothetical protein